MYFLFFFILIFFFIVICLKKDCKITKKYSYLYKKDSTFWFRKNRFVSGMLYILGAPKFAEQLMLENYEKIINKEHQTIRQHIFL
jgi:uncharacterized protein YcgL (UPF0745 family)